MSETDRILKTISFPAQCLELGYTIVQAQQQKMNINCQDITFNPINLVGQTINGKQFKFAMETLLTFCPADKPTIVLFMEHFSLTSLGALGILVLTSNTFEEALQCMRDYLLTKMAIYGIQRIDENKNTHLIFNAKYDFGKIDALLTEIVIISVLKIKPFLQETLKNVTIHFTHAPLGKIEDYVNAFECNFIFNSDQNKIIFPQKNLKIPMLTASPTTHMAVKLSMKENDNIVASSTPITLQVRRFLQQIIKHNNNTTIAHVAESLLISERTLSRRLKLEGTTFSEIKNQVGITYAQLLLIESDKTIAEIASKAGFTNSASFTRAFKRITMKTPTQYKNNN